METPPSRTMPVLSLEAERIAGECTLEANRLATAAVGLPRAERDIIDAAAEALRRRAAYIRATGSLDVPPTPADR